MKVKSIAVGLSGLLSAWGVAGHAHTNSVGFLLSGTTATGTCVAGVTTAVNCVNVEVFLGSWHDGYIAPLGNLGIWIVDSEGNDISQVIGVGAGGEAIPFALNHSLLSTLPNELTDATGHYGTSPTRLAEELGYDPSYAGTTTYYDALASEFSLGSNYFWSNDTQLVGSPEDTGDFYVYNHQSAIAVGLGAGTYRIGYDAPAPTDATWQPEDAVQTATFTITAGGSLVVNKDGDAAPLIQGPSGLPGDAVSAANLTPGDADVHTFTADEDVTWSISGTDSALFNIDPTSGQLSFASGAACTAENDPGEDMSYSVRVTATDTGGNTPAQDVTLTCPTDEEAPTVTLEAEEVETGVFKVTFTFSEDVEGFTADDVNVENGTIEDGSFTGSGKVYSINIVPAEGQTATVTVSESVANDPAGNGNSAGNPLLLKGATPQTALDEAEADVLDIIRGSAVRSLGRSLDDNRAMVRGARGRLADDGSDAGQCGSDDIDEQSAVRDEEVCSEPEEAADEVPMSVNATTRFANGVFSTAGTFFEAVKSTHSDATRIISGDFSLARDTDAGTTTAAFSGRFAWEFDLSDDQLFGYFLGGNFATSEIANTFTGSERIMSAQAGLYTVRRLQDALFLDGYVAIGAGRNNLDITNGTLELDSAYTTRSVMVGGALTGEYQGDGFQILPELSVEYGRTMIGTVGLTGTAYGLTDSDLSLNAGSVSVARAAFRPEFIVPLSTLLEVDNSLNAEVAFAPKIMCERVQSSATTTNCGRGAELALTSSSDDGLSTSRFGVSRDWIGDTRRTNYIFRFSQNF